MAVYMFKHKKKKKQLCSFALNKNPSEFVETTELFNTSPDKMIAFYDLTI